MRLVTWNVNSVKARLPRLLDWLETRAPDVVCLQETKVTDEAFPTAEVRALGYEVAHHGSGRWNGVAVLSRLGLDDVRPGLPGAPEFDGLTDARALSVLAGGVRVWSVYVPNGRTLDDPHYGYKLEWFGALREAVRADLAAGEQVAVCGDYNVARTDADVWDIAKFVDSTHVTPAERAAVDALEALGLVDVVPRPGKGERPFTYWDYRAGRLHKDEGMRIDYLLLSAALAAGVTDAHVDREARKGTGASDHAPVIADLAL